MVRRGSAVRVRQRALQKRCKRAFFCSGRLADAPDCGWVWSRLWSLQVEEAPSLDAKTASLRWFPIPRSTPMRVMTPYLRGSR
jgi:hypothetical protein